MEIKHKQSVSSTNDWAREHAASGGVLPMAFVADTQTVGRGQRSNTWDSPVGWTYLSIAFPPQAEPATDLPLAVAKHVCEVLAHHIPTESFWVKPPNDVYRSGPDGTDEKVAGILVEQNPDALIIGIGVDYAPEGLAKALVNRLETAILT